MHGEVTALKFSDQILSTKHEKKSSIKPNSYAEIITWLRDELLHLP